MGNTAQIQERFTLLDAFLNNKEAPIREFYVAEYPKTKRYVLTHGGTIDNANDVFQEAFFSCWKRLSMGKFSPNNKSDIEAYLFTTAKNKWIDHTRMVATKKTISMEGKTNYLIADDTEEISDRTEKEQQLTITLAAFENLGEACKELLTQFYFYKMSLRDIAEKLTIEEASAKNKKYRCIQKLKELAFHKINT